METFTDDTVVALASFLAPRDMLSLALTCKRFGDKNGTDNKTRSAAREEDMREVRQRIDTVSLMEVAASTVLHAKWTDEEKNALPRRDDDSWIGIYQEFIKLFRLPLQFDKLVGVCMKYIEDKDKTTVFANEDNESDHNGTAICCNIMRAGRHYVSFQVNDDHPESNGGIACGIMRPTTKDITSEECCFPVGNDLSRFSLKDYEILHGSANVDCCLMNTWSGICLIRRRWKEWEESELLAMDEGQRLLAELQNKCHRFEYGMERIRETSFKIGLVLDLDEGALDVYKNDRRLGTIIDGLDGEYCWVVFFVSLNGRADSAFNVSISR